MSSKVSFPKEKLVDLLPSLPTASLKAIAMKSVSARATPYVRRASYVFCMHLWLIQEISVNPLIYLYPFFADLLQCVRHLYWCI